MIEYPVSATFSHARLQTGAYQIWQANLQLFRKDLGRFVTINKPEFLATLIKWKNSQKSYLKGGIKANGSQALPLPEKVMSSCSRAVGMWYSVTSWKSIILTRSSVDILPERSPHLLYFQHGYMEKHCNKIKLLKFLVLPTWQ